MNLDSLLALAGAAFSTALACAAVLRKRRPIASWCFAAGMVALAGESVCEGLSRGQTSPERIAFWQSIAFVAGSFLPGAWVCFSVTYSRGNYRQSLIRWRFLLAAAFLLPCLLALPFRGQLIEILPYKEGNEWWVGLSGIAKALSASFLIASVLILMNLERTLRAAVGTMRWRIKLLVVGLGVIFGARFYTQSQALIFSGYNLALTDLNIVALLLGCVLIVTAYFRSGFSEIDVYPSRAVLQTSITVLLAGSYLFFVGVLSRFVAHFGGEGIFALEAFFILIALVFLAILLLSNQVRQKLQLFISRHFKRPEHDFRQVWTRFSQSVSVVLDENNLCIAASKLISETFNALSVSIWLFDERQERLIRACSTLHSDHDSDSSRELAVKEWNSVNTNLFLRPFELEKVLEKWIEPLKQIGAGRFRTGGSRICVPLVAGDRRIGVIILADRVNGLRYTPEELDLLKCIGDQVAVSLMNLRLTKEIVLAKELEAFQSISAFFIHDLKNTASTLGLMLQNLPIHFDDPAFRQDALRGISSTADRINLLINRLQAFREQQQLKSGEVDLNALITDTLENLNGTLETELITELEPVAKIVGDREQLQSVITNLLFNARDAVGKNGRITIQTKQRNDSVILSVSDNGCGMTAGFIGSALFRPFSTTKKKGLGIGMYQVKTIVEAHRGHIQVESKPGTGTTFQISLPLSSKSA